MKKLLLGLVVLIVLAIGALAVLNFVFDQKKTKRQTISGKVTEIVIKSDAGDVDLKPGSGPVEIRETQHYVIRKPKLKQKLEGGVLTLDTPDCDIPVVKCYSDLELTVPAGIKVTVDSDSGDIDANGISVLNAHLETDSGDVKGDFKGRQLLAFAHTDSGDVDVAVEDARAVDAQTDSGDVKVDADGHPLKIVAKTDSGDVDVAVPAGHYAIDADSDSGDAKTEGLTDTDKSPKSIEAKSDSGDVKIHAR
jgi:DUF4097 and DUF4098 domain-containing protein YvlB